jgi:signal transduction histidine kinase
MFSQTAILVVGEQPESSRMLAETLSQAGYVAQAADSAEMVSVAVKAVRPDLIIAELKAPSAKTLSNLIRREDRNHDIPIIVVTESTNMAERAEAVDAGASDIITSPFHEDEFLLRVCTQIELGRLREETEGLRVREMAAIKRAESALRESESRFRDIAIQESERLVLFAAGVAHDFNNLLGAAYAELETALSKVQRNTPARRPLQNIQDILAQASDLVDLLISYSSTGHPPAVEAIDVSAVVEDIMHVMRSVLSKKAVRLTGDLPPHLPRVLANEAQIRRVVMNLITNAAEAIDAKPGSIDVSTSLAHIGAEQPAPEPNGLKEGDYVRLSIADTGRGMTEEAIARAMDPFFTTKPQGRGLGLAVVQGIVRSHGGAIRVSSSSGRGTTFQVLLPCTLGLQAYAPGKGISSIASGHNLSVLFIEDEAMLRSATGTGLEQKGFNVCYACDGEEALKQLCDSARNIDVVVLDLTLPGKVSGGDVLARVLELRPGAAIVLTSGHYLDTQTLDSLAGATKYAFVRKPYRLPELAQAILAEVSSVPATRVSSGGSVQG